MASRGVPEMRQRKNFFIIATAWLMILRASAEAAPPQFDVRSFRQLSHNISAADFERSYAASNVALPTVFSDNHDTNKKISHEEVWSRQNLYKHCGSTPLLRPGRQCINQKQNRNCHHVRIVHESLVGQTWGGTTVADLSELRLQTVRDVLTIQDRSRLGYEIVLFDAPLLHHCPSLKESVRVPKFFPRDYYLLIDWLHDKDPAKSRNWPSIIVSKKGGGTFLHADSGMTRFWAQQLSGRKRWRVFPLSESHKLYPTTHVHYYYPIVFQVDAFQPDFEKFPDLNGATVYETITEPGDVIFIPEGWAHQVENLEDSVLTSMNFLDNHAVTTAAQYLQSFQHTYNPELFSAFFMPLDNPVHQSNDGSEEGGIRFDDYFASRLLHLETVVPASVQQWVQDGGAKAIDTEWDATGMPALHVAVFYNYHVVLDYLIGEGGANVNALARDGVTTALDVAELSRRREMRDLLLFHGASRGRLRSRDT